MYFPKHQIKKLTGSDIPKLIDNLGNIVNPFKVIKTGNGKYFEYDSQIFNTGNFNKAVEYFKVSKEEKKINEAILTEDTIDRSNPTIKRYFLYNKSTENVVELKKEDFFIKKNNLKLYEKVTELDWQISGPVKDVEVNGYFVEGVETVNRREVKRMSEIIPNIENKITNYTKFHKEETEYKDLPEYKKEKASFYVPSPSTKL